MRELLIKILVELYGISFFGYLFYRFYFRTKDIVNNVEKRWYTKALSLRINQQKEIKGLRRRSVIALIVVALLGMFLIRDIKMFIDILMD